MRQHQRTSLRLVCSLHSPSLTLLQMSDVPASAASGSPAALQPTVYWAQTDKVLHLKVDVKEADKSTIKVKATGPNVEITAYSKLKRQHREWTTHKERTM